MCCKSFLQRTSCKVVSGDTMMNKALGPVWHTKHKAQGVLPERLRGVDQEATWSTSRSDGWVYGHGSFCLVSHSPCLLGAFTYMRNSAHEAKRLWWETGQLRGLVTTVIMDGTADDQALFAEFQRQRQMTLLTTPRSNSNHTEARQRMIQVLNLPKNRQLRQQRRQTVEPVQGVVKDISRWIGVGCVVIAITVGCSPLWALPCNYTRPEPSKRIARRGRSSKRSWACKNAATPQLGITF
jgi:hypothetical protein